MKIGEFYEIIGRVQEDLTVRVMDAIDAGSSISK